MAQEKEEGQKKKVKRPSALKRDLQSEKRRIQNRTYKAKVQTAIRAFETSKSKETLNQVYSLMDKGVKTGLFAANKASRSKARLAAKLA